VEWREGDGKGERSAVANYDTIFDQGDVTVNTNTITEA